MLQANSGLSSPVRNTCYCEIIWAVLSRGEQAEDPQNSGQVSGLLLPADPNQLACLQELQGVYECPDHAVPALFTALLAGGQVSLSLKLDRNMSLSFIKNHENHSKY